MKNSVRRLFRWLPVSWKSRIDYWFDRSLGKEFGGPFNGQAHRQQIFRDLIDTFSFDTIVETGTFRGVTTSFMATEAKLPVYTVEAEKRFYYYARLNVRKHKLIHVSLGDSRDFISRLSRDPALTGKKIFFYLDAHWHEDLPLYKELELIDKTWNKAVVMIDDFQVPDDPGYQYDDYGKNKSLTLDYVRPLLGDSWSVFFPSLNAAAETGYKRGCVVLVKNVLKDDAMKIGSMKLFQTDSQLVVG